MKRLIPLLFLALPVIGEEYSIGIERSTVTHQWWDDAKYVMDMDSIRLNSKWDNITLSLLLGASNKALNEYDTNYKNYSTKIKLAAGLELLYNFKVNDNWDVFLGVGKYEFNMPKYNLEKEISDSDSNAGPTIGARYHIDEDFSVVLRYNRYQRKYKSKVKAHETTEGLGIGIEYKF